MSEELKINITKSGIKVDANGFSGKLCIKELEELEKYLTTIGITSHITNQTMKSESYQKQVQTNKRRIIY